MDFKPWCNDVGSFIYEHALTCYQLNLLDMVPRFCSFSIQIKHLDLYNGHLDYTDCIYCGHPNAGILLSSHSLSFYSSSSFLHHC